MIAFASGPGMEDLSFDNDTDISQHSDESFDTNNNNTHDTADNSNTSKASSSRKIRRPKRLCVSRTYGLRPRTQLRRPSYDCESEDKEKEPGVPTRKATRSKTRSPIAAKCRRLTANARERQRMKEINEAFSTLRGVLPTLQTRPSSRVSMTKIRTLRLAVSYIQTLSDLLSGADSSDLSSGNQLYDQGDQKGFSNPLEGFEDPGFKSNQNEARIFCPQRSDVIQGAFVSNSKHHQDLPFTGQVDRTTSDPGWEDEMHASDEELFSLLEKEVLNMRNKQQQSMESNSTLPEINWSDDLLQMGCK